MKKICFILSICLFIQPSSVLAKTFIISDDDKVNETVVIDEFNVDTTGSLFVDMHLLQQMMKNINQQMYKAPIDAKLSTNNEIIPGIPGQMLDKNKFIKQFQAFFYQNKQGKMRIPTKAVHPKVDGELLTEISAKEIGFFSTSYNETNKERSHNIRLAAEAIDNHVLFPGETFSFNKVVGERTKEKGYKRAPVIVKGELAEDIGGGICQVSSTLFNAVNLQGIQIMERYSHSREVPYVPPGKDATVSWWGPDFVFKNKYKQPLLIRASAKNGTMIIRIFSSDHIS
ncbi:hypothetical protein FHP05_00460 [Cerasibacillus terrae]|uniref:YoaR-like putative peptidoglycan binding domain-containing protein n=1 Tax=Cerasibacillus terrae TaxID=2498845 RepID=A0A5C8P2C5_9BACI|nr:VanW family protein [Cerasibacillus terrae]TXL67522.1 hypothetical protein FHP05_00460 [Cerasibacillus terrae]